ncbi:GyrI-like domain-containing protein [Asanoa iriomotensis]|uniref:DNA gyrase inhibitor n=1 Tax=Asanoa iriomotensis TaxID=234613 RepID=A0ABQ4C5U4_9ACTN|nr:GyrI-like domain-containing protein [Asanoa iriomotensis]GIF58156.1 DNA gyrase inhibitor [Asanoa iriomotensis]
MTDIHVEQREPQPVLSIRQTIPVAELTQAQGASLHELWQVLQDGGITPAGAPFVRYHTFGDVETDVETGVPVAEPADGTGRVRAGELPSGRAVRTVHLGGHDRLGEAYNRIQEWLETHGTATGPAWEVYEWIDLAVEPDPAAWPSPADWRTQLIQPVS